ncbi:MAG: pantoate--beta-alanine ligase, partial [Acidobacteriota bacterium]
MPKLVHTVGDWQRLAESELAQQTVGFVPTLGALHAGHESLLRRSLAENDVTVLSIFLNPTQFDDPNDLGSYPGTFEADLEIAHGLGVDYVFCPTEQEMYPEGYRYRLSESELSTRLCGASRPGHFDGVLTVVLKLLLAVRPKRAYFGEKDYQQLELVRGMVRDFFLDVEIVPCPTIRHADGLAISSRNELLTPGQRQLAPR